MAATPGATGASRGPPKKKLKDDVIQVILFDGFLIGGLFIISLSQVSGTIIEALPSATFRVEIEPSKQIVLATVSGKIRKNMVRIIVGDSVELELSAYDLTRGRITYRNSGRK